MHTHKRLKYSAFKAPIKVYRRTQRYCSPVRLQHNCAHLESESDHFPSPQSLRSACKLQRGKRRAGLTDRLQNCRQLLSTATKPSIDVDAVNERGERLHESTVTRARACKFDATVCAYRQLQPIQTPRGCKSKPPTRSASSISCSSTPAASIVM